MDLPVLTAALEEFEALTARVVGLESQLFITEQQLEGSRATVSEVADERDALKIERDLLSSGKGFWQLRSQLRDRENHELREAVDYLAGRIDTACAALSA